MHQNGPNPPGRQISLHGSGKAGIALLWHGRGPLESYALQPLAEAVATSEIRVLAADWDSAAPDHGKSDLEASLAFARSNADELGVDPQRLVLVGWSLGATAALGLALQSAEPLYTILIAPGYAERAADAFSGQPLPEAFPPGNGHSIDVLWGNRDDLVDETMAVTLTDRLRAAGWAVTATELDADHSGVVGMRFDDDLDRYVVDPLAADAMAVAAAAIVAATTP
ncbi:MAG: alpha/beta fold hydrolase [Aeromicrobium sp.]